MMTNRLAGQFGGAPFKYFGDWTDRVAKGELPKNKPPRPQGVERNVVVTSWEWGTEKTLSARPDLVGSAQSDRQCLRPALRLAGILDRQHADPRSEDAQGDVLQDAGAPIRTCRNRSDRRSMPAQRRSRLQPSAYWGDEKIWDTSAPTTTTPCSTSKGRVWLAATVRGMDNPAFCKKGSDHPSAKVFPLERSAAPGGDARSQDDEIHLHRHLLRHASSAVRL